MLREENVIRTGLERFAPARHNVGMKKSDLICPTCNAGYRRIELTSLPGVKGEYRCQFCELHILQRAEGFFGVSPNRI